MTTRSTCSGSTAVGGIIGAIADRRVRGRRRSAAPRALSKAMPGQVIDADRRYRRDHRFGPAVATFVILIIINIITGVRVSQAVEVEGLDINLHGEVVQ